jgi:hypothetical protein
MHINKSLNGGRSRPTSPLGVVSIIHGVTLESSFSIANFRRKENSEKRKT